MEVLQISPSLFHGKLIMEGDSSNAISRVSSLSVRPWKFHFYLVKITSLALSLKVTIKHDGMENALVKQAIDEGFAFCYLYSMCSFV